jgi:hypothetical protein
MSSLSASSRASLIEVMHIAHGLPPRPQAKAVEDRGGTRATPRIRSMAWATARRRSRYPFWERRRHCPGRTEAEELPDASGAVSTSTRRDPVRIRLPLSAEAMVTRSTRRP